MEMQVNCDLELRLLPPPYDYHIQNSVEESSSSEISKVAKQESQMLTIFYNGNICVSSDLIHLQAKAILSLATGDMEERSLLSLGSSDGSDPPIISNKLTRLHHQRGSMRGSLRSFLQKRNVRIQATCPYHHSQ